MLLFQFAPERSRVLQGTAAEAELGGDWRGNRSGGCGRNPWGADGGESGAGIHRATASSASAHYGERSRANERSPGRGWTKPVGGWRWLRGGYNGRGSGAHTHHAHI